MTSVRVTGGDRLRRAAAAVRRESRGGLQSEIRAGLARVTPGFAAKVRSEVPAGVPSGYAPVLAADITVDTHITGGGGAWPSARLTVSAGRRRLQAIDAGVLRHPVYGRRSRRGRPRPWVAQRVRGQMVKRASRAYQAALRESFTAALRRSARRIEGSI